ncbi:hypothetical protein PRIC2_010254 [Phytophthora ramorum]
MILDQQDAPQDQGIKMALTNPRRRSSVKSPDKVADTCEMNGKMVDEDFNFESPPTMRLHGGARIQPAPENAMKARDSKAVTATSLQYILEVRRLLYLTEFLVLINYVGVFIPLVFLAIDTLPLVDPSEGSKANKFFWLREYYTFLVITFLAIEQFRYSLPILPYPLGRAIFHTAIVSALTVGLMYGLALFIGFPLPFSILFLTPPWLSFIASFLVIQWLKKIRETPGAVAWLINVIKLWICQVLMVFIYPPYYFVFTTLSPNGQTAFSMLLPVIKLIMRNIYVKTVVHLSDELPEVITFNIEIYNALFISYCMQNSPSFGTTLMVTAALWCSWQCLFEMFMMLRTEWSKLGNYLARSMT